MQRARWSFLVLKFLGARVNASSALLYITVPPLNQEELLRAAIDITDVGDQDDEA